MTPIYAVVVSPGRTGTAWLAKVMATDPQVCSRHEGQGDNLRCLRAVRRDRLVDRDAKAVAKRIILAGRGRAASVEVNGLLRYHVAALRRAIPGLRVFYLARNGRKVVNSILHKARWKSSQAVLNVLVPNTKTPFQQVCLYWTKTSRMLRTVCDETWRLEDILADYDKFSALMAKLGANVPERTWRAFREKRINAGLREAPPWTLADCRIFNSACADENAILGYEAS